MSNPFRTPDTHREPVNICASDGCAIFHDSRVLCITGHDDMKYYVCESCAMRTEHLDIQIHAFWEQMEVQL